jgi:probable HAF family extracellular repeat protein
LGGEYSTGWEEPLNNISNTGLIVGHSATSSGYIHGAAWTEKSGMVDLGALADIGYPEYKGSFAMATNRLGTLIVGWSGTDMTCLLGCSDAFPVVWTPSGVWEKGKWITKWKIHKLDTTAFPDLTFWYPMAINDLGQIVAMAFTSDWATGKPLLWNPQPDHKTWKIVELSSSPDFPNNLPFGINDRGEIAGATNSADGSLWTPRLWEPLNSKRTRYTDAILLAIPEGFRGCEAVGINEFGDMTGDCYNDVVDQTTRWTTKEPDLLASHRHRRWKRGMGRQQLRRRVRYLLGLELPRLVRRRSAYPLKTTTSQVCGADSSRTENRRVEPTSTHETRNASHRVLTPAFS